MPLPIDGKPARGAIVAGTVREPVPLEDSREPLRVLIASLALGGAERIVVEWLTAEAAAGRDCELAVLHARRMARTLPPRVSVRLRGVETPQDFVRGLARDWAGARAPLSTHLVGDDLLALLWAAGHATVPVVHNAEPGWRNDPRTWMSPQVPQAVACAGAVAAELSARGATVPLLTLRHRPAVSRSAFDPCERERVRRALGVGPRCLVMLALGAVKPQKRYVRAIEVLHALAARRECVLVIAGGVLDALGFAELDRVIDAARAAGVVDRLRLPGFVDPVEPWLAAADMLVNVSLFEGLSMAVREALAAGLPVVATRVGGQAETRDALLQFVGVDAPACAIARLCARLPVRTLLAGGQCARLPRAWSLTLAPRAPGGPAVTTLFATANLNAGGAQRSLVNLARELAPQHRLAIAVCGPSTQEAFAAALRVARVHAFRPASTSDPCAVAESLLAWAAGRGVRTLCFWNLDAKVKLLVARFADRTLRLIDVSPGDYACEELRAAMPFADAIDMTQEDYYARLHTLVLKYHGARPPRGASACVIPNGVPFRQPAVSAPEVPRFLVSGRIAPSKRLDLIFDAFARARRLNPRAELHVVGQAEPRHAELGRHVAARAREPGVVWRGALPGLEYLDEPFSAAVVIGHHQGSPNAVLEALSAGIAVIANASGGTGEMVIDGHTGWLLAEDCTARQLARAMCKAASDPLQARALGLRGRDLVRAHHAMEMMGERYLALFGPDPGPDPCVTAIARGSTEALPEEEPQPHACGASAAAGVPGLPVADRAG